MSDLLRPWLVAALVAASCVWAAAPASAQGQPVGSEDDLYQDPYPEADTGYGAQRHAFAFGAGIVLADDELGNDDGEVTYGASYRWRVLGRTGRRRSSGSYADNQRHYRGRYPEGYSPEGGIQGYLEPEVAYWERTATDSTVEDLLLGLNLVGVVPTRSADFFLGVGFGVHSFDGEIAQRGAGGQIVSVIDLSEERLGANLHVGVEIYLSTRLGIFGSGRMDILETQPFDRQTKVWGGLRYHF